MDTRPIGMFDSGSGGLTVLKELSALLPSEDIVYFGDSGRTPYGTKSKDTVIRYTLQDINFLLSHNVKMIVIACNTASAKALRTIQQHDINPDQLRVLGVIRPTVEVVPTRTRTNHIGVLATPGTVASESYVIELQKQNPELIVTQQACPMWVPLIESGEHLHKGADYFVEKYLTELLERDPLIDTIILGCTHYPLLQEKIENFLNQNSKFKIQNYTIISQGEIVAESLADYLERHSDIAERALKNKHTLEDNSKFKIQNSKFLTTESATKFSDSASLFLDENILAQHIEL